MSKIEKETKYVFCNGYHTCEKDFAGIFIFLLCLRSK